MVQKLFMKKGFLICEEMRQRSVKIWRSHTFAFWADLRLSLIFNSTCYFRFLYIFRSNCMNSTPGPVIFLLIVVPGRAIPSLTSNPINHGLINYMDTKAKCRHLKKWTSKWTSRQVLIRVYRRYNQSSVMVVFVNCFLSPFLSDSYPPLPPFPVWISILVYTYTLCKGGGYGVLASDK